MSESSGPHTFNTVEKNRMGSVGVLMASAQSQLIRCRIALLVLLQLLLLLRFLLLLLLSPRPNNDDVTEDKELMMWGRHVMMGYANREVGARVIFAIVFAFQSCFTQCAVFTLRTPPGKT